MIHSVCVHVREFCEDLFKFFTSDQYSLSDKLGLSNPEKVLIEALLQLTGKKITDGTALLFRLLWVCLKSSEGSSTSRSSLYISNQATH